MNDWIYECEIFKKELRIMNWSLKEDEKVFLIEWEIICNCSIIPILSMNGAIWLCLNFKRPPPRPDVVFESRLFLIFLVCKIWATWHPRIWYLLLLFQWNHYKNQPSFSIFLWTWAKGKKEQEEKKLSKTLTTLQQ